MALIVQKYGGSSVSDTEAMRRVAKRIVETKSRGHQVVAVVSAMGDTTDDLLDMATELNPTAPKREMDILLSSGEQISMSLLSMAINALGSSAVAFTGAQAGIRTDARFGKAHITGMVPERVARAIQQDNIVIVAGFQGVTERGDVTTLGRGGSDTTAVALAAALNADVCEIYTDVDGLFSADPRIVSSARRLHVLDYEETLEMAANGAKILHLRAVEFARRYEVPLHVRSSFSDKDGTWISDTPPVPTLRGIVPDDAFLMSARKDKEMEEPIISGIAHDRSQDKITVVGLPDQPGAAAALFEVVASADANIDMIIQNISVDGTGLSNLSFTLPADDAETTLEALRAAQSDIGFTKILFNSEVGKLSLIGSGMRTNPGISATLFKALYEAGVNIEMISTSEVRISVLIALDDLDKAVRAVHEAFDLDSNELEAVVYGGTGR
ncbi:MAG: aspartate kinase [Varibaculum sp.]|nr:aspartate kinase [Varibaculum sp.]